MASLRMIRGSSRSWQRWSSAIRHTSLEIGQAFNERPSKCEGLWRAVKPNWRAQVPGALCQTLDRPAHPQTRMPPLVKRLLSAEEAGRYLGFKSAWPVRELKWKGDLPYVQIGKRRIMFDVHDLDRFVDERKTREQTH